MSCYQGDNPAHKTAVNNAESVRQAAVAAASTQAAVTAAEITYYRACLASAKTNNCGVEVYISALKSLGTSGS
jgi:hypothetical protein